MKLTARQRRFVDEYLVDLNATQAAIRAGYSARTADSIGLQLLRKTQVAEAIQAAMAKRQERTAIDAAYVVGKLREIAEMDVLDILQDDMSLKPVSQWPKIWRQYLTGFDLAEMFEGRGDDRSTVGILKKIRWPDKVKNLELLGRHLGIFTDRHQLEGNVELRFSWLNKP